MANTYRELTPEDVKQAIAFWVDKGEPNQLPYKVSEVEVISTKLDSPSMSGSFYRIIAKVKL